MMKVELLGLIRFHLRFHPGFHVEDLAVLLWQGVMGANSQLGDPQRFREELLREWPWVGEPRPGEPLLEPVDPVGRTYRLNLRPAKGKGIDPEELAELLLSQPRKKGEEALFWEWWEMAVELSQEGALPFPPDALLGHGRFLRAVGVPPEHSAHYRRLNDPRYRLINDLQDKSTREGLVALGLLGEGIRRSPPVAGDLGRGSLGEGETPGG